MGCAFSCTQHRITDSNIFRLNETSSIELISSPLQLINYFKEKENNLPKCIFIFGGSGSNKGEFIYEMICCSWINYRNEQMYECQQENQKQKIKKEQTNLEINDLNQIDKNQIDKNQFISQNKHDDLKNSVNEKQNYGWNSNTQSSNRSSFSSTSNKYQDNLNFVYSYIDIERLIIENLKERVDNLGECGLIGYTDLFESDDGKNFEKKFSQKKSNINEFDKKIDLDNKDKLNKEKELNKSELDKEIELDKSELEKEKEFDKSELDKEKEFDKNELDKEKELDKKNELNKKEELNNKEELNKKDELIEIEDENNIKNFPKNLKQSNLKNLKLENIKDENEKKKIDKENLNFDLSSEFKNEVNKKQIHNLKNEEIQKMKISKEFNSKKQNKLKRNIKNSNYVEFLQACEEDFESNQTKLNINYNSKKLKESMFTLANCVTNTWVFNLIEKEISRRNSNLYTRFKKLIEKNDDFKDKNEFDLFQNKDKQFNKEFDFVLPEVIYVINLIPNQINIFRHCLFLQQTPNLFNFNVNFIAINLISGDLRKKDLDSVCTHSIQDELNFNYMNYFRSINRLIDVQIRQSKQKIKIRITKGKNAIKMNSDLDVQFLFGALENNQEIDLSSFKVHQKQNNSKNKLNEKGNLLFLLDNHLDIGDLILQIEDQSLKMSTLRKFIQIYVKQKEKISFNRLYS